MSFVRWLLVPEPGGAASAVEQAAPADRRGAVTSRGRD